MPTYIVIELPDALAREHLPGRELCRADSLADLMNAIESEEFRRCRERRDAAEAATGTGTVVKMTPTQLADAISADRFPAFPIELVIDEPTVSDEPVVIG